MLWPTIISLISAVVVSVPLTLREMRLRRMDNKKMELADKIAAGTVPAERVDMLVKLNLLDTVPPKPPPSDEPVAARLLTAVRGSS